MNVEYRIRECGHGGFTVEKGIAHKGGEHIPGMLGSTMPAFIVYESAHFDTKRKAQAYIKQLQKQELSNHL